MAEREAEGFWHQSWETGRQVVAEVPVYSVRVADAAVARAVVAGIVAEDDQGCYYCYCSVAFVGCEDGGANVANAEDGGVCGYVVVVCVTS